MMFKTKAFTLLELILVMAIIVFLTVVALPAFTSVLRGSDITTATALLTAQFNIARMQAISRNRQVQVRIYSYADPRIPGEIASNSSTWHWHAIQSIELDLAGNTLPNKVQKLPSGAVIDENTTLSTILPSAASGRVLIPGSATTGAIPAAGTSYNYTTFTYNPDGSTDLSPSLQWFLTVRGINTLSSGSTPPANFATVQVDPLNGTTLVFRPSR